MSEFNKFIHDLKNPLAGIKGQAELLELHLEGKPELLRRANQINSAVDAICQMISKLQNAFNVSIEECDLRAILTRIGELFPQLHVDIPPSKLYVVYNEELVKSVLLHAIQSDFAKKILLVIDPKNVIIKVENNDGNLLFLHQLKRGKHD